MAVLLLGVCLTGGACRQDMQDQPKMKPYRGSSFFGDGLAMRQPVPGTIPRGYLRSDKALFTGKKDTNANPDTVQTARQTTGTSGNASGSTNANANAYPDDVDTFPFPITEETVQRGRERFNIFCSACHGLTGHGDGMVVRRGYRKAANFHDDRLRQAPVGHFFDVITNGWGAMPSYAPQVPVQDRWAIISYIRALQLAEPKNTQTASVPTGSPTPQATPSTGGHQ
ncbi:MAG TPA: cytochrome c [Pyrinomonadaceae bacterium]|nr:cytochrome c [Pyrinomonadaceae bacterium]